MSEYTEERLKLVLDALLAQRSDNNSYHNHKENVIYLGLALSASTIPASVAVFTSAQMTPIHYIFAASMLIAVILNHLFLRRQLELKARASVLGSAAGRAIDQICEGKLTEQEPFNRAPATAEPKGIRLISVISVGRRKTFDAFAEPNLPHYLADQIKAMDEATKKKTRPPLGEVLVLGSNLAVVAILVLIAAFHFAAIKTELLHAMPASTCRT